MAKAKVARFLDDSSERVVLEAARAIHDVPALKNSLGKLASIIASTTQNEAILRRSLNAHFRLGLDSNASALAAFAADAKRPTPMRIEALKMLQAWAEPGDLDRVMNRYSPLERRETKAAASAVEGVLSHLLSGDNDVRQLARNVASELGIKAIAPELIKVIQDVNAPGMERASALESLVRLESSELDSMTKRLVDDASPAVRVAAIKILAKLDAKTATSAASKRIHSDVVFERTQLSCLRCHEIGDDGGDVGPKLTEIGTKKSADYLLEAIVAPNAKLAEGFETIIVQTDEGEVISGIIKSQDSEKLTIVKPDGTLISIEQDSIEGTKKGLSSMPNDLLKYLNRRELRDLVAYLASLDGKEVKEKNAKKPKGHEAR